MKRNSPPPFEITFLFNKNEDEQLLEISAHIAEFETTPTIEYVYNLETAKYIDIDTLDHKVYNKLMNVVYDEITNDGGNWVVEDDLSDFYHDLGYDDGN